MNDEIVVGDVVEEGKEETPKGTKGKKGVKGTKSPKAPKDEGDEGNKVEKVEKVVVSVEMEKHTVIEYDRKGYDLVFDIDPLKVLPDAVYHDLSHKNQLQYTIAQQAARELQRKREHNDGRIENGPKIITKLRTGQASQKINKIKDDSYFHRYWAAPHEVDECIEEGYARIQGESEIKRDGKTELIPMQIPVERYEQHLKDTAKESRDRIRRSEEEFVTSGSTNAPGMKALNQTTRTKVKLSDLGRG